MLEMFELPEILEILEILEKKMNYVKTSTPQGTPRHR